MKKNLSKSHQKEKEKILGNKSDQGGQGLIWKWKKSVSLSVVSSSLRSHGLWPARLLCPWDSLGKSTGVSCHFLLQGIFPTQGSNLGLLHCRQILYHWATWEASSYVYISHLYNCLAISISFILSTALFGSCKHKNFCISRRSITLSWKFHQLISCSSCTDTW